MDYEPEIEKDSLTGFINQKRRIEVLALNNPVINVALHSLKITELNWADFLTQLVELLDEQNQILQKDLIEIVTKSTGKIIIPYEKVVLNKELKINER